MPKLAPEKTKQHIGKPKIFKTPEHLYNYFNSYIEYCQNNEQMPNIAGFMVWLYKFQSISCDRTTFYLYQNYDGYLDIIKGINEALEDSTLNNKTQKDLIKLAYLNNRCGYSNKNEVSQTVTFQLDDQSIAQRLAAAGYTLIETDTE